METAVKGTIAFAADVDSVIDTLVNELELNVKKSKEIDDNKYDVMMGRKKYRLTLGERFVRIAREDQKIQIAYSGNKNTKAKLMARIAKIK